MVSMGFSSSVKSGIAAGQIVPIPPAMPYEQQVKLLQIAHETTRDDVRECALLILKHALNPMMMVKEVGCDGL